MKNKKELWAKFEELALAWIEETELGLPVKRESILFMELTRSNVEFLLSYPESYLMGSLLWPMERLMALEADCTGTPDMIRLIELKGFVEKTVGDIPSLMAGTSTM